MREHRKIIGFRNILIHGYAEVDDTVVWSIIVEKLPLLLEDAETLLSGMKFTSKPGLTHTGITVGAVSLQ